FACLEQAYAESYMRYDCTITADYNDATPDCNDPNEHYMGLQLAAAQKYNAMAVRRLREVQFLTAALTEEPDVYAEIGTITDAKLDEFRQEIYDNGLDPNQTGILHVFDYNEPADVNEPNRPSRYDIENVILAATDPSDPNVAALRELYKNLDNLFRFGHAVIAAHYLQSCALQTVVEEENLANHFQSACANDIAVTDVWPSAAKLCAGGEVAINVELENLGNVSATTDVNVYVYVDDVNTADILGPEAVNDLAAGAKVTLTFMWDTSDINEVILLPDGCTYRIKAEASRLEGEMFTFDNTNIGATVEVSPVPDLSAVPTGLLCTGKTHNTISLAWTPGDPEMSGYRLYRDGYYVGWSEDSSCTDTGLIPCTTYTYAVSPSDNGDESGRSETVTVTTSSNPDINNDCLVDFYDLIIMGDYWLEQVITAGRPDDFGDIYCGCNGTDGSVDLFDFAILADRWRDGCD
ncbi:MAG: fibronectin type III domain-containing protein, partial [Phycisphaerales bacterium]